MELISIIITSAAITLGGIILCLLEGVGNENGNENERRKNKKVQKQGS